MGAPKLQNFITRDEYLEGEVDAAVRHEYIDGYVYAMAGATEEHEVVTLNIAAALLSHLRGKGCRVFKGDMKLRLNLNQSELFYYPDVMVVCEPSDNAPLFKTKPRVLVEVMSNYKSDHVEKLFAYQHVESLEEYLVIDQNPESPRAWLYRRASGWQIEEGAPGGNVKLDTLDFQIPLGELYQMG